MVEGVDGGGGHLGEGAGFVPGAGDELELEEDEDVVLDAADLVGVEGRWRTRVAIEQCGVFQTRW